MGIYYLSTGTGTGVYLPYRSTRFICDLIDNALIDMRDPSRRLREPRASERNMHRYILQGIPRFLASISQVPYDLGSFTTLCTSHACMSIAAVLLVGPCGCSTDMSNPFFINAVPSGCR